MSNPSRSLVFKATCTVLVILLLGQISLLFMCQCDDTVHLTDKRSIENLECAKSYSQEIVQLQKQVKRLNDRLSTQSNIIQKLGKRNQELSMLVQAYKRTNKSTFTHHVRSSNYRNLAKEFTEGETLASEFAVNSFNSYAFNAIYSTTSNSLANNPAQRPLPATPKGKEYNDVVAFALKQINEDSPNSKDVSSFDLVDGISRTDSLKGSEYELYFRVDDKNVYHKVRAMRLSSPLQLVGNVETIDLNKDIINLILPLSGRVDKFQRFMKHFIDVGIHWDRRVFLTVVYFGKEGKHEIRKTLTNISKSENFTNFKCIFSNRTFSRGLGLQKGALSWDKGNVLMFFCDVDIYFTPDFLDRCRFYTSPGQQVYYPIVYSLYNPVIVFGGEAPSFEDQFKINKDSGFWREYGFGMVCHYRSDFIKTGGFDLTIKGWGKEDIKLYRKYLRSKIKVIRSVDRGIFHLYHHKHCKRDLTDSQYLACLNSKIKSEGSHTQLGLIAFGGNIFDSKNPNWIEKLQQQALNKEEKVGGHENLEKL